MSATLTDDRRLTYNQAAVKYANTIDNLRQEARASRAGSRPLETLFPPHNRTGLGVALEWQAMGEARVSNTLQAQAEAFGYEFEHLGLTIGTVIHNIDLRDGLDAQRLQFVRNTLLERKVIFFREQHLGEDEHVAFARRFGSLDAFPFGKSGDNPYIYELYHGKDNPGAVNLWHTDVTWMAEPSLGSIAQCIDIPPHGGDTLFADSHAAYHGLGAELQEQLRYVQGIHDYRTFLGTGKRALPEALVAQIKAEIPFGVSHPLLRTHPETGKTALYLHGGFLHHDSLYDVRDGKRWEAARAVEVVRQLLKQHGVPEYSCRFKWAPGSMAFWDNRACQHYATSDYWPHRRLLRRVTVSGDKPFYEPQRAYV
ncbi:MAG: TauD/TfdA family dioxygenase [Pseudomonadota bacterium]